MKIKAKYILKIDTLTNSGQFNTIMRTHSLLCAIVLTEHRSLPVPFTPFVFSF